MKRPKRSDPSLRSRLSLAVFLASALFLVGVFAGGCLRDANARKQRFTAQGDRYAAQEKYAEAMITYGRALQLDPKSADVHYKIAKCHLKMFNWASAYRELQRTIELDPQNWGAHLDLGQLYLLGGKAADAKNEALTILRSSPEDVGSQILLANADAQLDNTQDALREAENAIRMAPDNADTYTSLAVIQQKASAFKDAETNLQKARTLSPNSLSPIMALGSLYSAQKHWSDAEQAYQSAIAVAPKSPSPRAALAAVFIAQGKSDQAEDTLRETKAQLNNDPIAYRMLGDFYVNQGDNAKALTEFASLVKEHPADFNVRKSYAQLLILSHQLAEATKITDEILTKSPQDDSGLVLKGQILLQTGKMDDALQALQQGVKANSANAYGHYELGMAYLAKGNGNQAEGEWRSAVQIRPDLAEAWIALGKAASDRRDWSGLEPIGEQLIKTAPASPAGYLFHATARMNQSDAAGAEADLKRLIELLPQNPLGYAKLGQLRAFEKRWNEAASLYQQALSLSPGFLDAIQGIADLDFQRGKAADALQFIQTKIDANPNDPSLYLLQGQAFLRDQKPADAKESFTKCVELDKQNLNAFVMLAQVQQTLGNMAEATADYEKAIALAPHNAGLYTALGAIYDGQGNWQQAQTLYQRALAIQPDEALAANNLAYLMLEHGGNVTVALTLAQNARRGFPKFPNSADTLGWAYYQNAAYSLAAPLLEDAVKAAPANATYRYHLGMTYQKLNDLKRARIELEKSIRIDPHAPFAEKATQTLSELTGD